MSVLCVTNTVHPPRIKGRAIFRPQKLFLSPVQFFGQKFVARPVFPYVFSLKFGVRPKNTKKMSPVLCCSKIGRPSCFLSVLLYAWGVYFYFLFIQKGRKRQYKNRIFIGTVPIIYDSRTLISTLF